MPDLITMDRRSTAIKAQREGSWASPDPEQRKKKTGNVDALTALREAGEPSPPFPLFACPLRIGESKGSRPKCKRASQKSWIRACLFRSPGSNNV